MRQRVVVKVEATVIIDLDGGVDVLEVMDDISYSFVSTTPGATVFDTELNDYREVRTIYLPED